MDSVPGWSTTHPLPDEVRVLGILVLVVIITLAAKGASGIPWGKILAVLVFLAVLAAMYGKAAGL